MAKDSTVTSSGDFTAEALWDAIGIREDWGGKFYDLMKRHEVEWEDFDTDRYDWSIEIYGCEDKVLPIECVKELLGLGFSQIWTHTHTMDKGRSVGNIEWHYSSAQQSPYRKIYV